VRHGRKERTARRGNKCLSYRSTRGGKGGSTAENVRGFEGGGGRMSNPGAAGLDEGERRRCPRKKRSALCTREGWRRAKGWGVNGILSGATDV